MEQREDHQYSLALYQDKLPVGNLRLSSLSIASTPFFPLSFSRRCQFRVDVICTSVSLPQSLV